MRILIDGRLYGLENAGLGRYLMNLVTELCKLDHKNNYVLLLRRKYFESLELPDNWKKVLADFRHYSFAEQSRLPALIKKENPDITHFPHFNVPLLYLGKNVVTIHDMLMHEFNGLSATTLPVPLYFFKQLIYKFVFATAIYRATKIIVPSKSVKNDLLSRYKIDSEKVDVIYEG
jgi:glycosyltransferase involved in cell wall biosynthesis